MSTCQASSDGARLIADKTHGRSDISRHVFELSMKSDCAKKVLPLSAALQLHARATLRKVPPSSRPPAAAASPGSLPYADLHEQAPDMWFCLDRAGAIVQINRPVRELLGYAPEEIVGRSICALAHPESIESARLAWQALAACATLRDADVAVMRKDGSRLDVSASANAILDPQGRIAHGVIVWRDITRRKQSENAALEQQGQLRALAYEIAVAEERERRRIAEGLHDELGQLLAIAKLKLGELGLTLTETASRCLVDDLSALMDQASQATRSTTFELSPHVLHHLGLEAAVESLCRRFERVYALRFRCERDVQPVVLPEEMLVVLFRVVRELLFNVHKHAQARNALVAVHRGKGCVMVRVEDDGVGFAPEKLSPAFTPGGGFGLFSAAAQIQALGGHIAVDAAHRPGSRIVLNVPLPARVVREARSKMERRS
jgi:PAS domain S-box-containing protein